MLFIFKFKAAILMNLPGVFSDQLFSMHIPEVIAVITGVLSVWFAKKENILVYPIGIISVLLYVYICLNVKLYADAAINFYYFLASIYGWYFWKHGGKFQQKQEIRTNAPLDDIYNERELNNINKEEAEISYNNLNENLIYMLVIALLFFLFGYILDRYTDSDVAWVDAFTTSVFCIAMYAMAKKKIENWILWIIGDAVCIPLFLFKGLPVSALQFLIFTIIAIAGYAEWFKKLEKRYSKSS